MQRDPSIGEPAGVAILSGRHVVRLKWHRLKRRIDDVPFSPSVLGEALRLGASCEIDLRLTADGGFAVLHDATLDRETTGSGPVREAHAAAIRELRMRAPDGTPTGERVLLLEDLAELAGRDAAPGALIQLDLKESAAAITEAVAVRFAVVVAPVADRFILSGLDFEAVRRLADATKGLALGFDPCAEGTLERLVERSAFEGFVADAVAAAPAASMIYLDYHLILKAATLGYDIVAAFHEAGWTIDAYTLNTSHPYALGTLRTLVGLGVDQITTDEPIELQLRFAESASGESGAA